MKLDIQFLRSISIYIATPIILETEYFKTYSIQKNDLLVWNSVITIIKLQ